MLVLLIQWNALSKYTNKMGTTLAALLFLTCYCFFCQAIAIATSSSVMMDSVWRRRMFVMEMSIALMGVMKTTAVSVIIITN